MPILAYSWCSPRNNHPQVAGTRGRLRRRYERLLQRHTLSTAHHGASRPFQAEQVWWLRV